MFCILVLCEIPTHLLVMLFEWATARQPDVRANIVSGFILVMVGLKTIFSNVLLIAQICTSKHVFLECINAKHGKHVGKYRITYS